MQNLYFVQRNAEYHNTFEFIRVYSSIGRNPLLTNFRLTLIWE